MIKEKEKSAKKHPELLVQVAHYYVEEGSLSRAIKTVKKFQKKFPDDIAGMLLIAMIQEKQGQFDEAESSYRNVIEIDPKNIRAIIRLANLEELRPDPSDYWKRNLLIADPLSPLVKDFKMTKKPKKTIMDEAVPPDETDLLKDAEDIRDSAALETPQQPDEVEVFEKEEQMVPADDSTEISAEPSIEDEIPETPGNDQYTETESTTILESDTTEQDGAETREPEIAEADELQELPPLPESADVKYTPSSAEVNELQRIYREIEEHQSDRRPMDIDQQAQAIHTTTLAEIFASQGNYKKAIEIYNALPENVKAPHQYRIQELEVKLNEQQNQDNP